MEIENVKERDYLHTSPEAIKRRFLERIEYFMKKATDPLNREKQSYKDAFDKKMRPKLFTPVPGMYIFVHLELFDK